MGNRVVDGLYRPVDTAFLAAFRIGFGVLMAWEVIRHLTLGWIDAYWIDPDWHFTWRGFGWVQPWPGTGMYLHFLVMGVAAACMAIGLRYRVAATVFAIGFVHVFLLDKATYLNHFYLIAWLAVLMPFLPAGRAWSVDAWRSPSRRLDVVPAWTLFALRALVGIPYFYGGIAKLNQDWLAGEPVRSWLSGLSAVPPFGPWLANPVAIWTISIGGVLFDLLIVPMLLWSRTRPVAFLLVLGFHLTNAALFRIGVFPWLMLSATLVFLPPDWPRRAHALLFGLSVTGAGARGEPPPAPRQQRLVAGALAAALAFHLVFPLRHLLYPGNVHWTEQGHRFSWHMMARSKHGDVRYLISYGGPTLILDPATLLSERQFRKMSTRPDMILHFAHYLARRFRSPAGRQPTVRALVPVSLNGRAPRLLIDPDVDLAREPRSSSRFILSHHERPDAPSNLGGGMQRAAR